MHTLQSKEVLVKDLNFLLHAVQTFDAEMEQLEITEDWYSSESRDILESAKEILRGILGIEEIKYDDDGEEIHQETFELYFD